MYMRVYVCICGTYVDVSRYLRVRMCVCMCAFACVCACVCVCLSESVCPFDVVVEILVCMCNQCVYVYEVITLYVYEVITLVYMYNQCVHGCI